MIRKTYEGETYEFRSPTVREFIDLSERAYADTLDAAIDEAARQEVIAARGRTSQLVRWLARLDAAAELLEIVQTRGPAIKDAPMPLGDVTMLALEACGIEVSGDDTGNEDEEEITGARPTEANSALNGESSGP
jgi:hypothetical protein